MVGQILLVLMLIGIGAAAIGYVVWRGLKSVTKDVVDMNTRRKDDE